MTMLPQPRNRVNRQSVPISWRDAAWTVRILIRPASAMVRRLSQAAPIGGSRFDASRGALPGRRLSSRLGAKTSLRPVAEPLRGRVSRRRRLSCDSAAMRRLAAFASLPLSRHAAPRVRIFRVFQHPQFAL